ncbi:DUF21 and CBS domain protein (Mam3) [Rasamsonia emersonii CBS 393.64]|uniref:DUF21 and CBS domain protein (Mam3) n=1 Tax=Rasamsonia emersonii (strain ATCC 16479 / CBS 393.64 / IMI 116815) TaxID=1408163 RepID=A0A0F4YXW0_RASE3|nr:DUF21 and CBS domain protein (Mam3) [Rasamsonia emersonii CBS 393.64]KKA23089.1 DUF21 and CBS domain protein (Mam3) [Rasamsonia emersonii CBS 393.64]
MSIARVNPYLTSRPVVLGLAKALALAIAQLPPVSAAPASFYGIWAIPDERGKPASDPGLWLYMGISIALVLGGGAFAGLTIALMGQVIKTSGEASERKNAAAVLNLLKKGKHWVLVTLLLSNVITNETLPIVLDRSLGGGWPAVVGSTVLIVIFGEIVPQSICVRYGLPIGAWMAPFVLVLMYLLSPVAWPIAKLLDKILGEDHGTVYKKAGLKTLVTLHKTLGVAGEQLNSDEVTIISACLDLKEKSVGSIMTPMEDVFTMSADTVLDERTMDLILSQGYSRIPIHAPDNPQNFVGMLLVKMLITYDPEDCKMVRDFALATLPETRPETSCLDIVNFFQEGKSHMVLVSEYPGEDHGALGVVTLEDVIEELIGEEIIDESDVFIDVHKAIRRLTPAPKSRFPKGRVVEEPASLPTQEDNVVDLGKGTTASPPVGGASSDAPNRRAGSISQPPAPRFLLRNKNGELDPAAPNETVTKRGTDEVREHLRHLGPSNLASRPRQTRYQNVKIKAPGCSPTRAGPADSDGGPRVSGEQIRRPSETIGCQGGIGAGLLHSAGKDAKDGVHALKSGYGTIGAHEGGNQASKGTQANLKTDLTKLVVPELENENQAETPHSSPLRTPNRSKPSSVHSYETRAIDHHKGPSRISGPARSGSITEQVIDVNGIRKVILQTTSSSSSDTERPTRASPVDDAIETNPSDNADGQGTQGSKKKRRRRKRKPDGKDGERQPLLH